MKTYKKNKIGIGYFGNKKAKYGNNIAFKGIKIILKMRVFRLKTGSVGLIQAARKTGIIVNN